MDNNIYGNLSNVVYYSYFDTAVNQFLIEQGVLDIDAGETIGLVVHTECDYFALLAFPGQVEAGLRTISVGGSSVQYEIGLFGAGQVMTAARGRFVHVYVDRASHRPRPLPADLRRTLESLDSSQPLQQAP